MSLQLIIIVELNLIKTKDDDFYLIDGLWLTRKFYLLYSKVQQEEQSILFLG